MGLSIYSSKTHLPSFHPSVMLMLLQERAWGLRLAMKKYKISCLLIIWAP